MLKSCQYCGRVHDDKQACQQKKQAEQRRSRNRKGSSALMFRRSKDWTDKSIAIRKRDRYLCLCCLAGLPGTASRYNTSNLSVHHITPIEEDYSGRLDNDNLITLCSVHHEMCEAGKISRQAQRELVRASEEG